MDLNEYEKFLSTEKAKKMNHEYINKSNNLLILMLGIYFLLT